MRAAIAEITAEPGAKKGFEPGRFIPSAGGDESGHDVDRLEIHLFRSLGSNRP